MDSDFPTNYDERGCPIRRDFRRMGIDASEAVCFGSKKSEPSSAHGRNSHPCKKRKSGAATVMSVRKCASPPIRFRQGSPLRPSDTVDGIGYMSNWRTFIAVAVVSMQPLLAYAQSTKTATTSQPASADTAVVPEWLAFPIPPALYEKWRKYGQWDYKQQGFQYRDSTQFNFGATGGAAGLDEKSLIALAQSAKPTRDDVRSLDYPELQGNFLRDAEGLDGLRKMAEQDAHVIRIAVDFTLLDADSKWPRENVGFSEARWSEYRSAFKKLSLSEGMVRTEDFPGAIFFITRVKGLCTGGSSAGYVYSTVPLTPTAKSPQDDLDVEARKNPSRHYAYVFKPLKANWYAFYQIDW